MSQKTPIKKEIEGLEFTFTMMPPRKARAWINRALGHFSQGVGVIGNAVAKSGLDGEMPLGDAFSSAVSGLDPGLLDQFMDELANYCIHKEVPLRDCYDVVFLGRPGLQYAWFLTAVEVQFSDFLPGIIAWAKGRLGADVAGKLASLSRSTSTG